jgi:hypothetical protein
MCAPWQPYLFHPSFLSLRAACRLAATAEQRAGCRLLLPRCMWTPWRVPVQGFVRGRRWRRGSLLGQAVVCGEQRHRGGHSSEQPSTGFHSPSQKSSLPPPIHHRASGAPQSPLLICLLRGSAGGMIAPSRTRAGNGCEKER